MSTMHEHPGGVDAYNAGDIAIRISSGDYEASWHLQTWHGRNTAGMTFAEMCAAHRQAHTITEGATVVTHQPADPFVTKLDPFPGRASTTTGVNVLNAANAAILALAAGNQKSEEAVLPGSASSGQVPEGGGVHRAAPSGPLVVRGELCAYDRCQAGGVILDGAPAVGVGDTWYHPGCWSAFGHPGVCRIR